MAVIGEAFVEVKGDTRGFGPETERGVLTSVGSIARKAATIFAAAFAGKQAIDFFRGAISGASDLEEAASKVAVVFGEQARSVEDFARNSATAFGISRAEALGATGTFGNLLRAVGLSEDASAKFSTTMVGLASDLASFNNTSSTEALDALRSGLVGETEPLKRFGVNINEALLKQKAFELGLGDGKAVLDSNAKAQAAYALIMEQTSLAQGDFARTSGGLANQQRILGARFADVKARIGTFLLPAITTVVKFLADKAVPAFAEVAGAVGAMVGAFVRGGDDVTSSGLAGSLERFGLAARRVFDDVRSVVGPVVGAIIENLGRMRDVLSAGVRSEGFARALNSIRFTAERVVDFFVRNWPSIQKVVEATAKVVGGVLPVAFRGVVAAVQVAVRVITDVTKWFNKNRDIAAVLAVAIGSVVVAYKTYTTTIKAVQAVTKAYTAVQTALNASFLANPVFLVVAAIAALAAGLFIAYQRSETFRNIIDSIGRFLRDTALPAVLAVGEAIGQFFAEAARQGGAALQELQRVVEVVVGAIQAVWDRFGGSIITIVKGAFTIVSSYIKGAFAVIKGLFDAVVGVLTGDWGRAWDGIKGAVSGAFDAVRGIVSGAFQIVSGLFRAFTSNLGDVWGEAWDGLKSVVGTVIESVVDFVKKLPGRVINAVSTLGAELLVFAWGAFGSILRGARDAIDDVIRFVKRIPGMIVRAVGNAGEILLEVGKDIIRGLVNGIKSAAGLVKDAVGSVIGGIGSGAKKLLKIGSPSKVFMEIGGEIMNGLALGIERGSAQATAAVESITGAIAAAAEGVGEGVAARLATQAAAIAKAAAPPGAIERASAFNDQFARLLAERGNVETEAAKVAAGRAVEAARRAVEERQAPAVAIVSSVRAERAENDAETLRQAQRLWTLPVKSALDDLSSRFGDFDFGQPGGFPGLGQGLTVEVNIMGNVYGDHDLRARITDAVERAAAIAERRSTAVLLAGSRT